MIDHVVTVAGFFFAPELPTSHLATYLGHISPGSTYYYLQFTPELRQLASQRFHRHFAHLFTVGGIVV
jgi:hypothetical protein